MTKQDPQVLGIIFLRKMYPRIRQDLKFCHDSFDGRNPASVHVVYIPLSTGFHTSQVVQDF